MSLPSGIWGAGKNSSRGARQVKKPRACGLGLTEATGLEVKLSNGRAGARTGQSTGPH